MLWQWQVLQLPAAELNFQKFSNFSAELCHQAHLCTWGGNQTSPMKPSGKQAQTNSPQSLFSQPVFHSNHLIPKMRESFKNTAFAHALPCSKTCSSSNLLPRNIKTGLLIPVFKAFQLFMSPHRTHTLT